MMVNTTVATKSSTKEYPFPRFRLWVMLLATIFVRLLLHPGVQGYGQQQLIGGVRLATTDDDSPADCFSRNHLGNHGPAHIETWAAWIIYIHVSRNGKTSNRIRAEIYLRRQSLWIRNAGSSRRIRSAQ